MKMHFNAETYLFVAKQNLLSRCLKNIKGKKCTKEQQLYLLIMNELFEGLDTERYEFLGLF